MTTSQLAAAQVSDNFGAPASDLLGPHSLHWRYAGDNRLLLIQVKTALLQLMHPGLGAAIAQHSRFYNDSFAGLTVALPAIHGVTYDWPNAQATARDIRDRHFAVKGVDPQGRRYHALEPLTYFWGHATMLDMMVTAIELFDHRLTRGERERLYRESLAHYELYGVSMRAVPRDVDAFARYFDDVCANQLELTAAAAAMLRFRGQPPQFTGRLARPLAVLGGGMLGRLMWWIGLGSLPSTVQRRIGLPWGRRDERRLHALGRAVGAAWVAVPAQYRYSQRAWSGIQRTAAVAEAP